MLATAAVNDAQNAQVVLPVPSALMTMPSVGTASGNETATTGTRGRAPIITQAEIAVGSSLTSKSRYTG